MTLNWGYALSSALFIAIFVVAAVAQISAKRFHPFLYWAVIVATTTAGTTMADFADRSLGIGYPGGSVILFVLLLMSLAVWYWQAGSISVDTVASPKVEMFYWTAILFSQTLGTALGDWMADSNGLGRARRASLCRRSRPGRGRILVHKCLANDPVLDRLHSHAPTGGYAWRSSG
jgi:uncharacterized membrane-anchored protein